jgi:hypothetical protein
MANTLAPFLNNLRTIAYPILTLPPVTSAYFPSRLVFKLRYISYLYL